MAALLLGACITGRDDETQDGQASVTDGGNPEGSQQTDGSAKDAGNKDGASGDSGAGPFGPFVLIQPGSFWMGTANQEACSDSIKEARHQVTLTRGFEMQKTEVTQGQFQIQTLMGYNTAQFQGTDAGEKSTYCGSASCDQNPVERVSWHEAAYYSNKLSEKLGYKARCYDCSGTVPKVTCTTHWAFDSGGKTIFDCPAFRLPSEAEWEYAYRAKTTTAYYNGENSTSTCYSCSTAEARAAAIGWYCQNADSRTHVVARKMPNPWGLMDMGGNVEEWTEDWHTDSLGTQAAKDPLRATQASYRVTRGGSFESYAKEMRAAARRRHFPTNHPRTVGFRVVRDKKNQRHRGCRGPRLARSEEGEYWT